MKQRKGWRMGCDVGEMTERLENEQSFCRFTYVTAHSPTLLSLLLRHSSFSNPSFASPTSQTLSLNSSGEPPMVPDLGVSRAPNWMWLCYRALILKVWINKTKLWCLKFKEFIRELHKNTQNSFNYYETSSVQFTDSLKTPALLNKDVFCFFDVRCRFNTRLI